MHRHSTLSRSLISTRIRPTIRLLAAVALAWPATTGCGMRFDAKTGAAPTDATSDVRGGDGVGSSLDGRVVTLAPGFAPNPIVGTVVVEREISPQGLRGFDCGSGQVSKAPNVVLEVTRDLDAPLAIEARGGVPILSQGSTYWCSPTEDALRLDALAAGRYELRIVSRRAERFDVHISDPTRGPSIDDDVPRLEIDAALADALIIQGTAQPGGHVPVHGSCKTRFRDQPDYVLTGPGGVLGPFTVTQIWAPDPSEMRVQEIPQEGAPRAGSCKRRVDVERKTDSSVALYFAAQSTEPVRYAFLVRGPDTLPDPLLMMPEIPTDLPVGQRVVGFHFPMLHAEDVREDGGHATDATVVELFMKIPPHLLVVPKRDLDEHDVSRRKLVSPPPRRGEPLMIVDAVEGHARVFTADLVSYQVELSDLEAATGELAFPETSRVDEVSDRRYALPEDSPIVAEARRASAGFGACFDRAMEPTRERVEVLRSWSSSPGMRSRIIALERKAIAAAHDECGYETKVVATNRAYERKAIRARTEQRNRWLQEIRARFSSR